MKSLTLSLILFFFFHLSYAQDAIQLQVSDTRNTNEVPGNFKYIARFDFKKKNAVGIPPGNGLYSGMLTIAPWDDATGDYNHQLNFNNDGLFYRTGMPGYATWNPWQKIVLADPLGRIDGGISLKAGAVDHVYMQFFARTNTPDIRSAWFGYGTVGSTKLQLTNEIAGGNIVLMTNNGNVGIDTATPTEKLAVNGNIRAKEIKVETVNWPDYVFNKSYHLPSLSAVKSYVDEHQHLPEIPSEQQISKEGLNLGEMNKLLLKKVEELTLYLIDNDQKNKVLNERINNQQKEMKELQQQVKLIAERLAVKKD